MIKRISLLLLLLLNLTFGTTPEKIKNQIQNILDGLPAGTTPAILIYNPLTQDTIFKINYTRSMIPASNTKLFTTATALNLMGGDYTLSTKILTDDPEYFDGVIDGNIYIKGYGNSTFTEEDLIEMAEDLKAKGILIITGNIIGDDTYFDDIYTRDDWISDEKANVKLPPISALVIDRNQYYTYAKRRGRTRRYRHYVSNPPLFIAQKLKDILTNKNVKIEGNAISGVTPENVIELNSKDILLKDLIALTNKRSDNFLAECLFKTLGAVASGEQGNSFYATQAILSFIEDNGIFSRGTAVVDGSGISRFNQITAGAITGLLEKMYFDLVNFDDYFNSFSIAGVDGTLEDRMKNTFAENNFRGKTGTLNGVSSLSGYLTAKNNDELVVCIIFEFKRGSWNYYRHIQDKIVEIVSGLN